MLHGGASCGYVGCVDGQHPARHPGAAPAGRPGRRRRRADRRHPARRPGGRRGELGHRRCMQQYGQTLGAEQWGKGTNVVLGPTINIVRDPRWGRAFESLGEDPYLAGQIGAADIQGIQSQGPMAQVKHYAVYNQETNRNTTADNAIVSDRAEREIYLPAFETSVKQRRRRLGDVLVLGHQRAVRLRERAAAEHDPEERLGLQRLHHRRTGAPPTPPSRRPTTGSTWRCRAADYYGTALTTAVHNGQVSQATIDDHVRPHPDLDVPAGPVRPRPDRHHRPRSVTSAAHTATDPRRSPRQGTVLLKNTNAVLPVAGRHEVDRGPRHRRRTVADVPGRRQRGRQPLRLGQPVAGHPGPGRHRRHGHLRLRARAVRDRSPAWPASASTSPRANTAERHPGPARTTATALNAQTWTVGADGSAASARQVPGRDRAPATADGTKFQLYDCNGTGVAEVDRRPAAPWSTRRPASAWTAHQRQLRQRHPAADLDLQQQRRRRTGRPPAAAPATTRPSPRPAPRTWPSCSWQQLRVRGQRPAPTSTCRPTRTSSSPTWPRPTRTRSWWSTAAPRSTMPWAGSVRGIIESWYPGQEYGNALASAALRRRELRPASCRSRSPQSLADVPAHTAAQWPGQNGTVQYSEGVDVGYRWYDSHEHRPRCSRSASACPTPPSATPT